MSKSENGILSRLMSSFFGGDAEHEVPQSSTAVEEIVVGRGGSNEKLLSINGVPNLFVDEGDRVVQFEPAFDEDLREFGAFGMKMLPDMTPHWSLVARHGRGLKAAVAIAIRASSRQAEGRHVDVPKQADPQESFDVPPAGDRDTPSRGSTKVPDRQQAVRAKDSDASASPGSARRASSSFGATRGRIVSWGEEEFPRRDAKPGQDPTYKSFAMRLSLRNGEERTLQGEGLKDAISDSSAQIGELVAVRRLGKIKVPAFNDDGSPKMRGGVQLEWDKWLWEIKR